MQQIFVKLETSDTKLKSIQTRIDKLSVIQLWLMKSSAFFDRYLNALTKLDSELDSNLRGAIIQDIDGSFLACVSYFIRCFTHQKGSLYLEINQVTDNKVARETFTFLKNLRDDEYVHWKGQRSNATVHYSFVAMSPTECEFAREVSIHYTESVGPADNTAAMKSLFEITTEYVVKRRDKELEKMRSLMATIEPWANTRLLNEQGRDIIIRT